MQKRKQLKKRTSSSSTRKRTSQQPKKRTSKKKTAGRPSAYEDVILPKLKKKLKNGKTQIEDLAFYGLTDEQLATHLGVTRQSIANWKKQHPEFREALDKGKVDADKQVIKSLFERATGYEHDDLFITQFQGSIVQKKIKKHYPPDTGACFIWLKNRQNWQDKPEFNLFDDVEINVQIIPRNTDTGSADEADT